MSENNFGRVRPGILPGSSEPQRVIKGYHPKKYERPKQQALDRAEITVPDDTKKPLSESEDNDPLDYFNANDFIRLEELLDSETPLVANLNEMQQAKVESLLSNLRENQQIVYFDYHKRTVYFVNGNQKSIKPMPKILKIGSLNSQTKGVISFFVKRVVHGLLKLEEIK